jgi:hypothetical protein
MGLSEPASWPATQDFLSRLRDWLRDIGAAGTWAWTRETEGGAKGAHLHLLLHVPAHLRDRLVKARRIRRFAALAAGARKAPARAVRVDVIGPRVGCERFAPATHRLNLAAVVAYVAKDTGAEGQAAAAERLSRLRALDTPPKREPPSCGFVTGARMGLSIDLRKGRRHCSATCFNR